MTEVYQFLRILYKNKLVLILVPLVTVVAAYFLVRELPDVYRSQARIATGLVDKTEQGLVSNNTEQDFEISRKFDNMIQMMSLKKVFDQVSYQILLQDLTVPESQAFLDPTKSLRNLTAAEKSNAVGVLKQKLATKDQLLATKPFEKKLITILEDMGYSSDKLQEKVKIFRVANSDYISLENEAKNPYLAAFVINTLGYEFIKVYFNRLVDNSNKTINFLAAFLEQKRLALHQHMNELKNYKIKNRVLNLDEQAKSLYGQMAEFELRREVAKKDIIAYAAAIKNINGKFGSNDRKYFESAVSSVNQNIVALRTQLTAANAAYVKSNFDARFKGRVDSLQTKLTAQLNESTDRYLYNPLTLKENLVSEKLTMEIARDLAVNSVATIEEELTALNRRFDGLVPNEARVQEFETEIDIASKEYIEALQKYNDARLQSNFPAKLKLAEKALPGTIQPSKKIVLVILSGVISFVFVLFVLFILFFLDNSIRYPQQLANATDRPVLGYVNHISGGVNLTQLQNETSQGQKIELFKSLVRSIRFELDSDYADPKIISVTGLNGGNGKTLLTLSLAWAFSRVNKKVLVIDGNFDSPEISKLHTGGRFVEDFIVKGSETAFDNQSGAVSILGNKGGDVSLLELAGDSQIRSAFQTLKSKFDVVLIETDSLASMNKAKEWITYSDTVVAVFESGYSISQEDRSEIEYLKNLNGKLAGWVLTGTGDIVKQTGKVSKHLAE